MSQDNVKNHGGEKPGVSKNPYWTDELREIAKKPMAQRMIKNGMDPYSAATWTLTRMY